MKKKKVKKNNLKKDKRGLIERVTHPNILPRTFGQKAADALTKYAGSWGFILFFTGFLIIWMVMNTSWLVFGKAWDEKPFILLNLILSCLAAIQAPIILMSQNRQAQKDRQRAEYDYAVNRKAAREIDDVQEEIRQIRLLLLEKKNTKKLK